MLTQKIARIVSRSYHLIILFLASLILSGIIYNIRPGLIIGVVIAQSLPSPWPVQLTVQQTVQPTVQQVVQQGIDLYQKGDFTAAVENWQQALH